MFEGLLNINKFKRTDYDSTNLNINTYKELASELYKATGFKFEVEIIASN